jgi:regulator of protease activity HflC (stomatin/prohibitin superfamily)
MIQELVGALVAAGAAGFVGLASAARIVKQYERGVVFRFGRVQGSPRSPGLTLIVPMVDRLHKVNMQIVTLPIPAQEGITRDNVTVRVDAVVYFKVMDATNALIKVEDYRFAVSQMAQTSLRSIIGKSDLDDLLSNREKLNQGLELMIDSPAVGWGMQIDRVEIKDVSLPDTMKRSMARQAEADRERRARIINADAELQASKKLAEAAGVMSEQPAALQLRLLQTVVAVAAEKNSTLVLPFPVELLRFLERAAPQEVTPGHDGARPPSATAEPAPEALEEAAAGPLPEAAAPVPEAAPEAPPTAPAQEVAPEPAGPVPEPAPETATAVPTQEAAPSPAPTPPSKLWADPSPEGSPPPSP